MDLNKMLTERFFKQINGVVWDLMTGRLGINTDDGIATLEGSGDDATVELNLIEQFGMPLPAFAQSTPIDNVKEGDLIYVKGKIKGWIVEVKEKTVDDVVTKTFRTMTPEGSITTWKPPKTKMLGFESGVMVVQSLCSMLPGGKDGLAGMQSNLMPFLMMGGDFGDMETLLPMMLLGQTGGAPDAAGGNMMQMMMMLKMMGGKSTTKNPLGGFFNN